MISTGCVNWVINPAHIRELEYHDYPDYTDYHRLTETGRDPVYGLNITFSNGDIVKIGNVEDIEHILAQYPFDTFMRANTLYQLRTGKHPLQLYLRKLNQSSQN